MNEENSDIKYSPSAIPKRNPDNAGVSYRHIVEKPKVSEQPLSDGTFYEIEYSASPIPGVGRFVRKPEKVAEPELDECRLHFRQMRNITEPFPSCYNSNIFFSRRISRYNAVVFYKQAKFMEDFSDDFDKVTPMTQYYPSYELMGYEQLRTYFTWRTKVRSGNIERTSLSYAFLYIYELLNNIGVRDPADGLDSLMSFWQTFREYDDSIDKYVIRWLRDYHVYYELPQTFSAFVADNGLSVYFPDIADPDDIFALFAGMSKYNIMKSTFFTPEHEQMIRDCAAFTLTRIRSLFAENGMSFDDSVFQPMNKLSPWTPFADAVFHPWAAQTDRTVILSDREIYICRGGEWSFSHCMTADSGRTLVGYIIKQTEAELRRITKYNHKLSADISSVTHESAGILSGRGISLENEVNRAVSDYYREATKIVVKVDPDALSRIRCEALVTQEMLTVPEGNSMKPVIAPVEMSVTKGTATEADVPDKPADEVSAADVPDMSVTVGSPVDSSVSQDNVWDELRQSLTETEMRALSAVLAGDLTFADFADSCGIMPEVLADGINEKSADLIGDSLLDEEFALYSDYEQQIRETVGCI